MCSFKISIDSDFEVPEVNINDLRRLYGTQILPISGTGQTTNYYGYNTSTESARIGDIDSSGTMESK